MASPASLAARCVVVRLERWRMVYRRRGRAHHARQARRQATRASFTGAGAGKPVVRDVCCSARMSCHVRYVAMSRSSSSAMVSVSSVACHILGYNVANAAVSVP